MRIQLLACLLSAIPAMAGLISNPTAGVFDVFTNPGVTGSYAGPLGSAELTATACFGGFCPGQAVPGAGPDYNVSSPLTMKLTSVELTCSDLNGCAAYVDAYFSFFATSNAQYTVTVGIDGQASEGLSFAFSSFVFNSNTFSNLGGNQTISVPLGNNTGRPPLAAINDSFSLGTFDVNAGDQIFASINLLVPDLPIGHAIHLPDSLTLTLVDTAVPEPATLGLMAAALAALVIGRKRL